MHPSFAGPRFRAAYAGHPFLLSCPLGQRGVGPTVWSGGFTFSSRRAVMGGVIEAVCRRCLRFLLSDMRLGESGGGGMSI
ncbi:hypothetical protein BaRGS_00027951 [Batillaria attramentaria]|uniref:Uncharacterized protein n=1 Tax=Batillaria attramentaria TaxID=370345 RepID=A0ABD0K097_9CAEN